MTDSTLEYYRVNAEAFSKATVGVDFSEMANRFLELLPPGAAILDLGCGSGRDSLYFLKRGFRVTAADGSPEMCRIASRNTGLQVRTLLFGNLDYENAFDGIWACASLLHLPAEKLGPVFRKAERALRPRGVMYASFKYGTFSGMRNGRFFTDFTARSFKSLLGKHSGMIIEDSWISGDARPDRKDEKWLNLLMRKV